jgi:hypothetical protein
MSQYAVKSPTAVKVVVAVVSDNEVIDVVALATVVVTSSASSQAYSA